MAVGISRLIISPHVDDDVIGCGGLLGAQEALDNGDMSTVAYLGVDPFHGIKAADRFEEAMNAAKMIGRGHWFIWPENLPRDLTEEERLDLRVLRLNPPLRHRTVNNYGADLPGLIADIEALVDRLKPDEAYLPWPSYNQDHQAVYRAAMVALRPHDKNHRVDRVLLYEEPDCFWPGMGEAFVPNFYRPLINANRKLDLYQQMPSQVRAHRSGRAIEALATIRGAAIGVEYAEAYHVLRWVE